MDTKSTSDMIDSFTKLYKRKYFKEKILQEIRQCSRTPDYYFSTLLIDIDTLMLINDLLGFIEGDQAIQLVANEIRGDNAIQYGGDRFFIILPKQNSESAYKVAERIRTTIEQQDFIIVPQKSLTVSIGIAEFSAHTLVANKSKTHTRSAYVTNQPFSSKLKETGFDGEIETIIRATEDALYKAKGKGRNTCVVYEHGIKNHANH